MENKKDVVFTANEVAALKEIVEENKQKSKEVEELRGIVERLRGELVNEEKAAENVRDRKSVV